MQCWSFIVLFRHNSFGLKQVMEIKKKPPTVTLIMDGRDIEDLLD